LSVFLRDANIDNYPELQKNVLAGRAGPFPGSKKKPKRPFPLVKNRIFALPKKLKIN
jgi:hypothetical protein